MELERRILSAASRLFARVGYHKVSTRAIAREAGVAEKTLYRRFGTKSALYNRVKSRLVFPLGVFTSTEMALQHPDFETAVRSFAHEYLRAMPASRVRTFVRVRLEADSKETAAVIGPTRKRMIELVAARVEKAQRAGEARAFDAVHAARALLRGLFGHAVLEGLETDAAEQISTELADSLVDIWLAAFIVPKLRRARQRALSRVP